jgi:hypothetical protein
MTPDAQQPQREHCEHECVCPDYSYQEEQLAKHAQGGHCKAGCCYDTRTRPHTPAPAPKVNGCTERCDGCDASTCAEACQEWVEQHDTTVARKATLAIIEELEKIKGSFKVLELKRSDEYKEAYNQIVNLMVSLRSTAGAAPMTEQQPQREYIITEGQLNIILDWLSYRRYNDCDVDAFVEAIRSHPHTPAPEQCPQWWFEQSNGRWRCKVNACNNHEYEDAITRAATLAERERVLKGITDWLRFDHGMISTDALRERIESLRSTAGEQGARK